MTEAVFQSFMTSRDALLNIVNGRSSLRAGYDLVLMKRGKLLEDAGFRPLSIHDPSERALLRLLTMGRITDREHAELFAHAFLGLPYAIKNDLVNGLSVDGYNDGKAILPYYMPALFSEGLKTYANKTTLEIQRVLESLMRFLSRVYEGTRPTPGQPGIVLERNLLFAKDCIQTEAFRMDPTVLDQLPITQTA